MSEEDRAEKKKALNKTLVSALSYDELGVIFHYLVLDHDTMDWDYGESDENEVSNFISNSHHYLFRDISLVCKTFYDALYDQNNRFLFKRMIFCVPLVKKTLEIFVEKGFADSIEKVILCSPIRFYQGINHDYDFDISEPAFIDDQGIVSICSLLKNLQVFVDNCGKHSRLAKPLFFSGFLKSFRTNVGCFSLTSLEVSSPIEKLELNLAFFLDSIRLLRSGKDLKSLLLYEIPKKFKFKELVVGCSNSRVEKLGIGGFTWNSYQDIVRICPDDFDYEENEPSGFIFSQSNALLITKHWRNLRVIRIRTDFNVHGMRELLHLCSLNCLEELCYIHYHDVKINESPNTIIETFRRSGKTFPKLETLILCNLNFCDSETVNSFVHLIKNTAKYVEFKNCGMSASMRFMPMKTPGLVLQENNKLLVHSYRTRCREIYCENEMDLDRINAKFEWDLRRELSHFNSIRSLNTKSIDDRCFGVEHCIENNKDDINSLNPRSFYYLETDALIFPTIWEMKGPVDYNTRFELWQKDKKKREEEKLKYQMLLRNETNT